MPVIRTIRFEVQPEDEEEMITRRNALVAAVRSGFPGLTEARLARAGEQVWLDSWLWESSASMDAAVQAVGAGSLPEAGPAFALLPGFIELHAHLRLGQVPPDIVLRHGLTTVRETGGPLAPPSGGDGRLRLLAAGPILTAPRGYPVPVFGPAPALEVADVPAARARADAHGPHRLPDAHAA